MSATVDSTPMTTDELQLLNDQVLPILNSILPPAMVPRALTTIQAAIEQSKKRQGMSYGGMLPNSGQLGISLLSPREFNLATTWTFRTNWASTTWQTLINGTALSKYTHLVILGYQDLEGVVRARAIAETTGGTAHPILDLLELKKSDKHFYPIEPYIIGPLSSVTINVFVEVAGYDDTRPWGFVVAPYTYLISTTFLS